MRNPNLHPESMMMSYGYHPEMARGAIKNPIYQTSTFEFRTAEEGKAYFEVAYGLREQKEAEEIGMIYSRLDNPNLSVLENRLKIWDGAEDCAVFESGMAAISTALFEFLSPGDLLLYSSPLYGGTTHFILDVLTKFGVEVLSFNGSHTEEDIYERLKKSGKADRLAMIYMETPANPTNRQIDIQQMRRIADTLGKGKRKIMLAVDNTFLGPIWQHPLQWGADLVLYSATKYIGGHSDVIAGACLGSVEQIKRIKTLRTFLGNMASPWTAWLLTRSLETLKPRMELQARNAQKIARFLQKHPMVEKVYYLGLLTPADGLQYQIFQRQCQSPGAMISFDIKGGEAAAFCFMNHLNVIKLAVSLGSTESLVQHPATMTHAGLPFEEKEALNVTDKLVRLSVGVENDRDLIMDIEQAFSAVEATTLRQQLVKS